METNAALRNDTPPDKLSVTKQKRSAAVYILLAVIILLQLGYTIFCFETKKTGSYGDEVWSYGLANSYYKPFIYLKEGVWIREGEEEYYDNYCEWVDGEVIKDYITVQPEQRFSYGSVVSNQTLDNHPPLYYMLLHTVCSFFPDSFSYSYAFVINCILLVINSFFVFKLGAAVLGSDKKGLLLCAFYAAGTGSLSTFIFLRQYSLLTTLTVCFTYFNAKLFRCEQTADKDDMTFLRKTLPFIVLTAFLAFNTHYFAVPYIGLLTLFMCIWLLCRRRIKKMFIYGLCVLAALLIFAALYPAAVKHTIISNPANGAKNTMGDLFEFRYLLSILLRYSIGLKINLIKTDTSTYILVSLLLIAAVLVPLGFLFRKEKWFAAGKERIKAAGSYYVGVIKRADFFVIFLLADAVAVTVLISKMTSVYYFGALVSRYVSYIMPFVCLIFFVLAEKLLCVSKHIEKAIIPVTAVIFLLLCVRMHLKWDCPFYLQSVGSIKETAELLEGQKCLVIIDGSNSDINLTEAFTSYLYKADSVYFVMQEELPSHKEELISDKDDIDMIFVPASWYALDEGQYAEIQRIMDERGEHYNDDRIIRIKENPVTDLTQTYQECRHAIDEISSDCEPQLFLNINMGYYYVMKCK